jgi:N-acyl-D-aspartate/D-glutamate deacylase
MAYDLFIKNGRVVNDLCLAYAYVPMESRLAKILNYPHAYIGLSDSGAHVEFQSGYGTGALPGRILRNSRFHERHRIRAG